MQTHATAMDGPEFLAAVAQQNEAQGLPINAEVFQTRSTEWKRDKQTIQRLRDELQNTQDRIAEIRRAAAVL